MDLGWTRKKAVSVNFIAILVLSLPCALGFNLLSFLQPLGEGTTIQDLEDFIVSNNLLPLGSLLYLLFCTFRYGWGWDHFIEEANTGKGLKFPKALKFYISYILPIIVLYIFIQGYLDKFNGPFSIMIPLIVIICILYIPLQAFMKNRKHNK